MRRNMLFFVITLFVVLTACSTKQNHVDEQPVNDPGLTEKENPDLPANMYPLTGIKTDEDVSQRPVGVIINNHTKARPQSGLQAADIVYEVLAEGDVTRFLAIYQSEQPAVIGPVRSARDYYIDLSTGYDAFFVAHGWSPEAKSLLQANVVDNINGMTYDGTLFLRDDSRVAPHNSYISFDNIKKGADENGISLEGTVPELQFLNQEELSELQGDEATNVRVAYSSREMFASTYSYNEQTEKYDRYSNNVQTVDRETNEAISLDNVLIVEMNHVVIDDDGRRKIDLTSGGNGILLQKGIAQEVTWENQDGRIIPLRDGKPAGLVPGKTWINIIPSNPGISDSVSYGN
ncbi:DUF3048 domain-containing protein [Bacillus sp. PS06]|uniref:DUF3048 domain-containing protein n=1 Tax=Bacillus sp. PS06 TaxID=2764176 RepID=UPI001781EB34|nr:DUF3048 domain-containing protein [Bacillus sp. PS06]MBD8069647.1 DUF3048 domain-containing protein [Bacillus sp. PS06]